MGRIARPHAKPKIVSDVLRSVSLSVGHKRERWRCAETDEPIEVSLGAHEPLIICGLGSANFVKLPR